MPILNLRNTAGEFEPIPAMIGPQGAQGVPGPNEITTATATPLSGVLIGKDGYVKEGVAGEDFAAAAHAHGSITNDGKIGEIAGLPLFTGEGGTVGTKAQADALAAILGASVIPIANGGSGSSGIVVGTATSLVSGIPNVPIYKWGKAAIIPLNNAVNSGAEVAQATPLWQVPVGFEAYAQFRGIVEMDGGVVGTCSINNVATNKLNLSFAFGAGKSLRGVVLYFTT